MIKVFIAAGDRTDRTKARLKYVLDSWGFEKFVRETEAVLGRPLTRIPESAIAPRPPFDRTAHVGVHPQKQAGLELDRCGDAGRQADGGADARPRGAFRTAWRRRYPSDGLAEHADLRRTGCSGSGGCRWRGGARTLDLRDLAPGRLVACTGATGCKFAAAHTKEDALLIAEHVDARLQLDQPVNVHLTGCHHSCAQHYIGDIGLIGAKVPVNEDGDTVEGYDIVVGGGFADEARIGRPLWKGRGPRRHPRGWKRCSGPGRRAARCVRELQRLRQPDGGCGARRGGGERVMTMRMPPVKTFDLLPENAPFTADQRVWLSGFFAGYLNLDTAAVTALSRARRRPCSPERPRRTRRTHPGTIRRCRSPTAWRSPKASR